MLRLTHFWCFQNSQQSTQNNADSFGYSMNNTFPDQMMQQSGPRSVVSSDQGLSPPYSNQSPPYSVQSNMVLSPHGYISEYSIKIINFYIILNIFFSIRFSLAFKKCVEYRFVTSSSAIVATIIIAKSLHWCCKCCKRNSKRCNLHSNADEFWL